MVKVRISYIAKDFCSWHKAESCHHPGGRGNVLSGNRDRESQHAL